MMPYGEHWEWRGFGQTDADFRAWFKTLPFLYPPSEKPLRDEYLWTPGCVHNVKLRYDALKFKRFIARQGAFERWREDETEFLPFPLDAEQVRELEGLLGIKLPEIPKGSVDRATLLALIARAVPPVHLIPVIKRRHLARWTPAGLEATIILEWTRIQQPRSIETVALEHEELPILQAAHARLAPHLAQMRPMNYLQVIGQ
jgi:hypothetical protein